MNTYTKMQQEYLREIQEEEKEELAKNSEHIESFKKHCANKGFYLADDCFSYHYTIGIVVSYSNILNLLNKSVEKDKEGLVRCKVLKDLFKKRMFFDGYWFNANFAAMAHPFFRRGFGQLNNYAPRFIQLFWNYQNPDIDFFISLDFNRVRIDVDTYPLMELDTWYGPRFDEQISSISDGVSKLRPPLDLDDWDISLFFSEAHSLDIKWETKDGIKSFQSEEFKTEKVKLTYEGVEYYPVRYIHAEYDLAKNYFRHFDGAIHFYTEEEYFSRRDSDFNYNSKNSNHIKTKSLKLFKMNGVVDVKTWVEFSSHFFTSNPLIFEYFEGKYPDKITQLVERRRNSPK